MQKLNIARLPIIEVFHADHSALVREGVRSAFHAEGYKRITSFATIDELREGLRKGTPDLLILSDDIGRAAFDLVRAIRLNELGRNPFILIVLTVEKVDYDAVKRAMHSGADDIVIGPVVPRVLLKRLAFLAMHRPLFISTADYLGPERRRHAKDRIDIPHLHVVNTFRDKVEGRKISQAALEREIRSNMTAALSARLESEGQKIGWACSHILRKYEERRIDEELRQYLQVVADTLHNAASAARVLRISELTRFCGELAQQVSHLADRHESMDERDTGLIRKLTKAYQQARTAKLNKAKA